MVLNWGPHSPFVPCLPVPTLHCVGSAVEAGPDLFQGNAQVLHKSLKATERKVRVGPGLLAQDSLGANRVRPSVESAPGQSPGWSGRSGHAPASETHTPNCREALDFTLGLGRLQNGLPPEMAFSDSSQRATPTLRD